MKLVWKRLLELFELFLVLLVIVVAVALDALILVALAQWLQGEHLGITAMPVIAVIGIFELIGTMVIVVVLFKHMGLVSPDQALGLPDGSVRAFLALSLLVLFGILTVFLFDSLAGGAVERHIAGLPADYSKEAFSKDHPLATNVMLIPTLAADKITVVSKDIYWQEPRDQSSTDFAKTLLTLIGTLMTAVISFYFGANTVSSAVATTQPSSGTMPAPTAATPNPQPHTGTNGMLTITVAGTNLNDITAAKVINRTNNAHLDSAEVPKSNATSVSFNLRVVPELVPGLWEIQLTDKNNKTVTVPGGITLT